MQHISNWPPSPHAACLFITPLRCLCWITSSALPSCTAYFNFFLQMFLQWPERQLPGRRAFTSLHMRRIAWAAQLGLGTNNCWEERSLQAQAPSKPAAGARSCTEIGSPLQTESPGLAPPQSSHPRCTDSIVRPNSDHQKQENIIWICKKITNALLHQKPQAAQLHKRCAVPCTLIQMRDCCHHHCSRFCGAL